MGNEVVELVTPVTNVADEIARVGFPIVCAALFVVIAIIVVKRWFDKDKSHTEKIYGLLNDMKAGYEAANKQMINLAQETMKSVQAQNDKLVSEIVHKVTTHTIPPEDNIRLSEHDLVVNDYLRLIHEKCNSSRVTVFTYHNGGVNSLGSPYPRMSMRFEYCAPGVVRIQNSMNKIYRSFMSEWCHAVDERATYPVEDNIVRIDDVELISRDMPGFYSYLKDRKIEAIYGISIRDLNKNPIGFMTVEYEDKTLVQWEQIEHCMHDKQLKIEAMLEAERKRESLEGDG